MFRCELIIDVYVDEKRWEFSKIITLPFAPFPGLNLVSMDGTGEDTTVTKVNWYPNKNMFVIDVEEDRWSSDWESVVNSGDHPRKVYCDFGWTCDMRSADDNLEG